MIVNKQKNPLLIYKFEAFELFKPTIDQINKDVISFLFKGASPTQTSKANSQRRMVFGRKKTT
ncbi:hypothetical protein KO494_08310 [Lacinutrix sp. C3R15]|nr:hypothetical protein [Lacinutrix sp. C3R15]